MDMNIDKNDLEKFKEMSTDELLVEYNKAKEIKDYYTMSCVAVASAVAWMNVATAHTESYVRSAIASLKGDEE